MSDNREYCENYASMKTTRYMSLICAPTCIRTSTQSLKVAAQEIETEVETNEVEHFLHCICLQGSLVATSMND